MNKIRILNCFLLSLVVAASLSACSATGPKFSSLAKPSEDSAVVYFVRQSSNAAGARAINIAINGVPFAELHSGGYTYARLKPGQYEFEQSFNVIYGDVAALRHKRNVEASVEGGKEYFVLFLASSGRGTGETIYIPVSTSPVIMMPAEIAFDFRFGFAEKQAALKLLKESRYENPLGSTANK